MIHKLGDFDNWQDMKNQVICGDALELLKRLPDNNVNLTIIDPPYDIKGTTNYKSKYISMKKFNGELKNIQDGFDIDIFFNEIKRVSVKFNLFCFCSNKQISQIMTWGELNKYSTTLLVWVKDDSTPFANGVWRQDLEFCVHIREKGSVFQGDARLKRKSFNHNTLKNKIHPTVKPIEIIRKYIQIGSNEGDTVLDFYMGSWTTAKGCQELGRNFIGCDHEMDYCKIGERRLAEQPLFTV